jgi:hypothetical protein
LLELIEIMLQTPALEARAPIGEHGNHVARFETNVVFAGLTDYRRRSRDGVLRAGASAVRVIDAPPIPSGLRAGRWRIGPVAVAAAPDGFGTGFTTSAW